MDFQELQTQIKELIGKNRIEPAIELLKAYFRDDDKLDEIIKLSARYFALREDKETGTAKREEADAALSQLISGMLHFLKSEEEETRFKNKVFQTEDAPAADKGIQVFFSLGSPHNQTQLDYIEELKSHLRKYDINLLALDGDDWDEQDPLNPIRNKMQQCHGCLSLALERSFVENGINKRGSRQESAIHHEGLPTPWIHIEAALAYQLKLPFLILKQQDLKSEGMIDDNLFEWRIVRIDPEKPEELDKYPVKSFIRMWVEEVRKHQAGTGV